MKSRKCWIVAVAVAIGVVATGAVAAKLSAEDDQERKIAEKDVPKPALDALKKLAAGAAITQFTEEKEHGSTFYEASWKGEHGNVDGLVTAAGDLVEIEEQIASDRLPQAVLNTAQKQAGPGAKLSFEKKTEILYEAKFKKGDRFVELTVTPDGRIAEREEKAKEEE